jgi:hypothetical protein
VLSLVFLIVPAIQFTDRAAVLEPPVFAVRTALEIEASPEVVWREVVAFTEIPAPTELLFRAGIAYPVRAEIRGRGPGAVRLCIFSTGVFVEPIEIWDAPRQLKFSVTSNPAPMQEWTPYTHIEPPHLHGFLVSSGGQFLLARRAGGGTLLEGTTWYRHSLWPAAYWRVWSDAIIHRIHLRVLRHIKNHTEKTAHSGERSFLSPLNRVYVNCETQPFTLQNELHPATANRKLFALRDTIALDPFKLAVISERSRGKAATLPPRIHNLKSIEGACRLI